MHLACKHLVYRQLKPLFTSALPKLYYSRCWPTLKAYRLMSTETAATGSLQRYLRDPLVWIDLEMTGLDIKKDTVIEIACVLTDGLLTREIEGPDTAINHPKHVFEEMNEWCIEHHNKSGLVQQCLTSRYNLRQAEELVLDFLKKQNLPPNTGILAGNSVYADKAFLQKDMPNLHDYLHYRIVDVSSIKELCRRWYPNEYDNAPKKQMLHRAGADIYESIKELRYYRQRIFKC